MRIIAMTSATASTIGAPTSRMATGMAQMTATSPIESVRIVRHTDGAGVMVWSI